MGKCIGVVWGRAARASGAARVAALALALMAVAAGSAWSQTTAANDAGSVDELAAKAEILAKPRQLTAVPENEPLAVDLSLVSVPGVPADLTQGVTAKAYTRYVTVENKKIGQIVLTGVEKDGRTEPLDSTGFATQFDLEQPELSPSEPVTIEGDSATLRAALERLQEKPEEKKEEEPQVAEEKEDARTAASNAGSNEIASGYKTPDAVELAPEVEDVIRIVTDGCQIRVDLQQKIAVQQTRVETTAGDGSVSSSACEDGNDRYPLEKSYSVCADKVDLEARTATAQFKYFYVDAGAARNEVTDCTADEELIFPIVEKAEGCSIYIDYSTNKAVPQASLIYVNGNNAEIQVRGCQASEVKEAVAMTQTTQGCTLRHDYTGGKSYRQSAWIYTMEGLTYQAGGCTDDGTEYAHETAYKTDAGEYICIPIVNKETGKVTLQSRIRISVDGTRQFVTECTPDTGMLDLVATTEGCENPATWVHDLAAGQSYGMERHYFLDGSIRNYVNNCQQSQVVYLHQTETTSWQPHDAELWAYPLDTIYIEAPTGRYDIVKDQVKTGAVQMPYEYVKTQNVENGQYEFSGCTTLKLTDEREFWKRPDETIHEVTVGEGTPVEIPDDCVVTSLPVWEKVKIQTTNQSCAWCYLAPTASFPQVVVGSTNDERAPYVSVYYLQYDTAPLQQSVSKGHGLYASMSRYYTYYEGTRKLTRKTDGTEIVQKSPLKSIECGRSVARYGSAAKALSRIQGPINSYCPTIYSGTYVYQWNNEMNW